MKINKLAIATLTLLMTISYPTVSWAETVIEKVARTGVLTAGTRKDVIPFAYVNNQNEWRGYSIEMLLLIREQLEKQLNREIALELVEVTPENRINKVSSKEVDIVCDSTSFTWNRDQYVDFSVSYFVTGTKLLVKKGSNLGTPDTLANRPIGVIAQTTNEQVIKLVQPQANIITFNNPQEGLTALTEGKIDAFAWDGILLEGLRKSTQNPEDFAVVPEMPYHQQGVACMVPEESSKFRDLVNFSLVKFMQGFVQNKPESREIFNTWFGAQGVVPVSEELVKNYFKFVLDSYEQIPLK